MSVAAAAIGAFFVAGAIVSANATPTAPALPAEKQAIVDAYIARQAAGAAHPAPKDRPAVMPSDAPPLISPRISGTPSGAGNLVSSVDTVRPPGDSVDQFTNSWYAIGPSLNVDVWAGTHVEDTSQAFLLVVLWDANRLSVRFSGTFDTPARVGAVEITGATGTDLTLTSADGARYTFDVLTHTFH